MPKVFRCNTNTDPRIMNDTQFQKKKKKKNFQNTQLMFGGGKKKEKKVQRRVLRQDLRDSCADA